jgi:hypothetical protein
MEGLKHIKIAIALLSVIVGSMVFAYLYNVLQQQQAFAIRVADCKNHIIALAEAEQRYKQDSTGFLNSLGSTLSGTQTQDYQTVRTEFQYTHDNCLDARILA